MHFASPLPWWLAALAAAAVTGLALFSYRRPIVRLSPTRRSLLVGLRALSLAAVVVLLCRPVILVPPAGARDVVVPILVDVSRSMRVADADGQTRIARAADLLQRELLLKLAPPFKPEVFGIGEALTPASPDRLSADARQSDPESGWTPLMAAAMQGDSMMIDLLIDAGTDPAARDREVH